MPKNTTSTIGRIGGYGLATVITFMGVIAVNEAYGLKAAVVASFLAIAVHTELTHKYFKK